jgi:hypothetical protein
MMILKYGIVIPKTQIKKSSDDVLNSARVVWPSLATWPDLGIFGNPTISGNMD